MPKYYLKNTIFIFKLRTAELILENESSLSLFEHHEIYKIISSKRPPADGLFDKGTLKG